LRQAFFFGQVIGNPCERIDKGQRGVTLRPDQRRIPDGSVVG